MHVSVKNKQTKTGKQMMSGMGSPFVYVLLLLVKE